MTQNFFHDLLLQKQAAVFYSEYDVPESVRRLSAVVRVWPFLPPFRQSLVGRVRERKVSLARFIPFVGNCFAPVFYGSFWVRDGVTVLEGYFALSLLSRIYHSVWLGSCLLMAVVFPMAASSGPVSSSPPIPQWQARLIFGLLPALMVLLFVLYVKVCKWFARNDTTFIIERVQSILQPERVKQQADELPD